jgi:hypothetical protein
LAEEAAVKKALFLIVGLIAGGIAACVTNPLTGRHTVALVDNREIFPSSFQHYEVFLSEHTVITGTAEARMVEQAGERIRGAAERWVASQGAGDDAIPGFLSTHPSHDTRIRDLRREMPGAKAAAARFGVYF